MAAAYILVPSAEQLSVLLLHRFANGDRYARLSDIDLAECLKPRSLIKYGGRACVRMDAHPAADKPLLPCQHLAPLSAASMYVAVQQRLSSTIATTAETTEHRRYGIMSLSHCSVEISAFGGPASYA